MEMWKLPFAPKWLENEKITLIATTGYKNHQIRILSGQRMCFARRTTSDGCSWFEAIEKAQQTRLCLAYWEIKEIKPNFASPLSNPKSKPNGLAEEVGGQAGRPNTPDPTMNQQMIEDNPRVTHQLEISFRTPNAGTTRPNAFSIIMKTLNSKEKMHNWEVYDGPVLFTLQKRTTKSRVCCKFFEFWNQR